MQGASDTPARMTCRACVHCYARAIDPTNLQTISHTAKRTKDLHLCAFEELGEGQKNEGPTPVCFGRLWRGTKERRAYICVLLKSQERAKRTKGLHLCAFEELGEGQKNEEATFACFGRLWRGPKERKTYICVLLKSQKRGKRTKGLHLCALGDSGGGQKNEEATPVCF